MSWLRLATCQAVLSSLFACIGLCPWILAILCLMQTCMEPIAKAVSSTQQLSYISLGRQDVCWLTALVGLPSNSAHVSSRCAPLRHLVHGVMAMQMQGTFALIQSTVHTQATVHLGRSIYTHTYTHTYIHTYICTQECTVHTHIHTYIHMYSRMYSTYTHTYIHTYVLKNVQYIHTCMHTYICSCIHAYLNTECACTYVRTSVYVLIYIH